MLSRLMRWGIGLALLTLTACASGMVLGGQAACTGSTVLLTQVTGECTRSLDELTEVVDESIAIQTADIAPFVTVDYVLTVETGRVAITFTDFHGNEQTTEASRTDPGSGSVRVQLDALNRLQFKLAPVDGTAEGVAYELKFVCDCMP